MVEVEVWAVVHADGEYTIHKEEGDITHPDGMASRTVKITVSVPIPKPVELVGTVAEEPDAAELKVA